MKPSTSAEPRPADLHLPARAGAPVVCDMSTAIDSPDERLRAYSRLFARLRRRAREDGAVVLAFPGDARSEVAELARREAACCPFLDQRVAVAGDEVVWTIAGDADADAVLDAFYALH
jgi:hypothetical protein